MMFITAVPITKLCASPGGGGPQIVDDMCYSEMRRAEACVDQSNHHALVNAGERDVV
jgi:hypothetical protein